MRSPAGGEIGEAPPVADEASRFRGSAPIGGHNSARQSVGTTVGKRAPPLRTPCYTSVGRGALTPPPSHRISCNVSLRTSDRCHWCGNPSPPPLMAPLPKGGWHGEAVTGGFRTAPTAGHTGPALQGVVLSGPGGQSRPPLQNPIGKRCVGADAYIGPPHRTSCNASVGATLAVARSTAPLVPLRRGRPPGRPARFRTAPHVKSPVIARAHRPRGNPPP